MNRTIELAWGLNTTWSKWHCSVCKEKVLPAQSILLVKEGRRVIGIIHTNCIDNIEIRSGGRYKRKEYRCIICGEFDRYVSFFVGRRIGYSSMYTYSLHYSCLCDQVARLTSRLPPPTRVAYFSLKDMNSPPADFAKFSLDQLKRYKSLESIRNVFKGFSTIKSICLGDNIQLVNGMLNIPRRAFKAELGRFRIFNEIIHNETWQYSTTLSDIYHHTCMAILTTLRKIGCRVCGKRLYRLYLLELEIESLSYVEVFSLLPVSILVLGLYSASTHERNLAKESILLQKERSRW